MTLNLPAHDPNVFKLVRNIPPQGARTYALENEQSALKMEKTFLSRYSDPTIAATVLGERERVGKVTPTRVLYRGGAHGISPPDLLSPPLDFCHLMNVGRMRAPPIMDLPPAKRLVYKSMLTRGAPPLYTRTPCHLVAYILYTCTRRNALT